MLDHGAWYEGVLVLSWESRQVCFYLLKGQRWVSSVETTAEANRASRAQPMVGTVRMEGHTQGSDRRG